MPLTRRDFVQSLFVASQATLASRLFPGNLHADEPLEKSLNFAVIGDWGRKGRPDQMQVSEQMGLACQKAGASFVASLGDNFYEVGVSSVDDPQWQESFENVYTAQSLHVPWHAILGNHDYCSNCDAQIDVIKIHPRWNMPARYYSRIHEVDPSTKLEIFHMDTSPFVLAYRHDELMSKNVLSQNTDAQLQWLNQALAASTAQWRFVMGHHPIYSSGLAHGNQPELIERLLPVLQEHKVHAYFAGHDHDLEFLKVGNLTLVVSGAGSEHRPVRHPNASPFSRAVSGFAMVSVNAAKYQLRFIDSIGQLLYTSDITHVA